MKLFYRISIFINIVFACYILVKGSELLTKDLIGAKDVRNAQQSYYKKQSADLEKLDDTLFGEETGSVGENSVPPDGAVQEGTAPDVDEKTAQAAASMQTLTCDTEYEVTVYDETQQTENSRMETLPASFIGKDRRQVILYTDIPVFSLPQAMQEEVMDGKYIQTEEELYNLLESYSS